MGRNTEANNQKTNIIESGTQIKGDIIAKGALRIDGEVEGNVICEGKLVLGVKGKIKGEIKCTNAELMGYIDGKMVVDELLAIKASAKIEGDIETCKISIEPNAVFKGTCNMTNKG